MDDQQKRELESFLRQTEGTPPPVFVGRTRVFEDIALAAGQVWEGTGAGSHGMEKAHGLSRVRRALARVRS